MQPHDDVCTIAAHKGSVWDVYASAFKVKVEDIMCNHSLVINPVQSFFCKKKQTPLRPLQTHKQLITFINLSVCRPEVQTYPSWLVGKTRGKQEPRLLMPSSCLQMLTWTKCWPPLPAWVSQRWRVLLFRVHYSQAHVTPFGFVVDPWFLVMK